MLVLFLSLMGFVVGREVCMTCYADSGECLIPAGYNVNCLYVSIWAGSPARCFPSMSDVYSFDLRAFAAERNLTVYGMANLGESSPITSATSLESCHNTIVAREANNTNTWPPLGNALNIDWEPCTGTPGWPTIPFRLDMGSSVQCTSNLPSHAMQMMMVYDGAQLFFQSGRNKFNCSLRYMFSVEKDKIEGEQSGCEGAMTPAMFIEQCGHDADYDLYVPGSLYSQPSKIATCGQDSNYSCVPPPTQPTAQPTTQTPTPSAPTNSKDASNGATAGVYMSCILGLMLALF